MKKSIDEVILWPASHYVKCSPNMPIIAYLGKTINEYNDSALTLLGALDLYCPVCGKKMAYHDKYPRPIKDKNTTIWINRVKCKNKSCNKTQAVLPDFIMPYKHYSADEIESVILDSIDTKPEFINTPASIATVRRWLRFYRSKTADWISKLKAILLAQTGKVIDDVWLNCHFMEQFPIIFKELPAKKTRGNILGTALIYINAYANQEFT
jgi:hypothetical protein